MEKRGRENGSLKSNQWNILESALSRQGTLSLKVTYIYACGPLSIHTIYLIFKKDLFLLFYEYFTYMYHICAVPTESTRGDQVP